MSGVTLQIVVEPPPYARRGAYLDVPLAVSITVNSATNGDNGDLQSVFAFATLLNEHGDVMTDTLCGTLAESAQPFANGDGTSGYFLFDGLVIQHVGRYRIRVSLMQMHASSTSHVAYVESQLIVVDDQGVPSQTPSKYCIFS